MSYLRAATVIGYYDTCKRIGQAAFIRTNQTARLVQVRTQLEPVALCKTRRQFVSYKCIMHCNM